MTNKIITVKRLPHFKRNDKNETEKNNFKFFNAIKFIKTCMFVSRIDEVVQSVSAYKSHHFVKDKNAY